jgi:HSP20 family protein
MKNPLTIFSQRPNLWISDLENNSLDVDNEIARWMETLPSLPEESETDAYYPPCSLSETDNAYVAQFDVPGVKKEDIRIELQANQLTISGQRSDQVEQEDARYYVAESSYGTFVRSLALPNDIDEENVEALFDDEDGVLIVKLPKLIGTTSKAIEVKIN